MTIFDLLFLALVFVSLAALAAAVVAALRGRGAHALRILGRWAGGAAVYLGIVAAVGWMRPQRVLEIGDPWCFDDWCLSVEHVSARPVPPEVRYDVRLRLFSRARRVSQRALGAWVCLVDARGNRYAPLPDPAAVPLDVRLGPGESVSTSRSFLVPSNAGELGLRTGHGVGGPAKFIIADEESLLHRPTYVRIGK
jgi:hypothetical protein